MLEALDQLLRDNPVGLLFVILTAGYLIGKTRVRGFEFGSVTGVLFAGLVFGHYGFELGPGVQAFGFALFIFSVGFQAGPSFFEVLRRDGARYFLLAIVVAATGFALAAWLANLFGFPIGTSAGLLAGALTTTPTLAAAQDALQSGAVALAEGMTEADAVRNVTTAYAITYLFGLIGLIVIIRTVPGLLGIDLPAEAEKVGGREVPPAPGERILVRSFRVEFEDLVGIPHRELKKRAPDSAALVRLRRGGDLVEIDDDTTLEIGDEITLVAKLDRFVEAPRAVGSEIADPELLEMEPDSDRGTLGLHGAGAPDVHGRSGGVCGERHRGDPGRGRTQPGALWHRRHRGSGGSGMAGRPPAASQPGGSARSHRGRHDQRGSALRGELGGAKLGPVPRLHRRVRLRKRHPDHRGNADRAVMRRTRWRGGLLLLGPAPARSLEGSEQSGWARANSVGRGTFDFDLAPSVA